MLVQFTDIHYIYIANDIKIQAMNILDFAINYPDEESCRKKFKEQRDRMGVTCRHCNCKEHYWLENKQAYECKRCRARQTLRSGTVMQHSNLPYRYWFVAMHLLTATKGSFSAAELQRQLGHKRYQPIWEMVNKLRDVMGKRDDEYTLEGAIELDDAFFSTEISLEERDKPLKRGRGSQKKTKVLVMAESKTVENPKPGKKPKKVRYLKMKVISDLKSGTITRNVKEHVESTADLTTDDSTSYTKLKEHVHSHTASVIPHQDLSKVLPWVHTAISNAKRQLLGVYYKIKPEYLQYYLNQFCYKFNRRYFGENQFERLLIAAVTYAPDFKSRIYNRNYCG